MNKRNLNSTAQSKQAMINTLEGNFGNVIMAAKAAKITPRTHYRWLSEDDDYAQEAENMRDICFRKVKDSLLETALKKIDKGDTSVLNKMLGIYFKKLPEEIERVSRYNNVKRKVLISVSPHPDDFFAKDPMTRLAVKSYMQDMEAEGKLNEIRQDLVEKYKEGTIGEGTDAYAKIAASE